MTIRAVSACHIQQLVPLIVERLGLPEELSYQMIPTATGQPMQTEETLVDVGAGPGSE